LTIRKWFANWCFQQSRRLRKLHNLRFAASSNTAESILAEIDLEIVKLQTELLSEKDLQKITEQIRKSIRE
jgi:hypothetical protein